MSVHTVRHWERLHKRHVKPFRDRNNRRLYRLQDRKALTLIRDLVQEGYTHNGVARRLAREGT